MCFAGTIRKYGTVRDVLAQHLNIRIFQVAPVHGTASVHEEDDKKEEKKEIKEEEQEGKKEEKKDQTVAASAASIASAGQDKSLRADLPLKLEELLLGRPLQRIARLLLDCMCSRIRFWAKEPSAGSMQQNTEGKARRPKCSHSRRGLK